MKIVVQKFGGSSLTTSEMRTEAQQRVWEAVEEGLRPVVVVSAMGRRGDPY
ncbi:MAG: aspartate kinase, partial [Firmicutes bacterium]|nr:aspartate kinase [Bacillota bacterium]